MFLSYRRGNDGGYAHALYDRLKTAIGAGNVFMDVEGHIRPGEDFEIALQRWLEKCDVLLVIIGPNWPQSFVTRGTSERDFVLSEVLGAIEARKDIVPVLVGGAEMPSSNELPQPLESLSRKQAVRLTQERFAADSDSLLATLVASRR